MSWMGGPGGGESGVWLQEACSLAALQTDEDIDSDSSSGMGSGLGSTGDSGRNSSSSGLSSRGDGARGGSSSGLGSSGGSGRDSSSTEPGLCKSSANSVLASSADAGECVPEWSDDVALALARAAGAHAARARPQRAVR